MHPRSTAAAMEPLAAGHHRIDPQAVADSQQYRIGLAAVEVLAEKGYAAATVADIIAVARVSRRTFYEFYPNKVRCFATVCALLVELVTTELDTAVDPELPWRQQLRAYLMRYLEILAAQPDLAYALTVQTYAVPELREVREAMFDSLYARFRVFHDLAREQDPMLPEVPEDLLRVLAGGLDELLRVRLPARDPASIIALAPVMTRAAIAIMKSPSDTEL